MNKGVGGGEAEVRNMAERQRSIVRQWSELEYNVLRIYFLNIF